VRLSAPSAPGRRKGRGRERRKECGEERGREIERIRKDREGGERKGRR